MSIGPSGALRLQVNKNSGTPGIFWQKEKAKNPPRKFGYKNKGLRHPIRQPDDSEAQAKWEAQQEEERRRFNRNNKDFIHKNRERFKEKDQDHQPTPGTHIKPGTVTLTQDQLSALLATLGKTGDLKGSKDNPLKISFDASNNKIEVEKYESDDSGDDVEINDYKSKPHHRRVVDDASDDDIGIGALLNGGDSKKSKPRRSRDEDRGRPMRRQDENKKESREEDRPKKSQAEPARHTSNTEEPPQTRMSWDVAKKEAGVANVPDTVPWKHLTVAEKKRLQWARERAEVEEDYNPWGRPGAGAPMRKQEEEDKKINNVVSKQWSNDTVSKANVEAEKKRKQEEIENEIEKLQREIREAETKKKEEEERIMNALRERRKEKERKEKEADGGEKVKSERKERKNRTQKEREGRREAEDTRQGGQPEDDKVQIVIITKKRDRSKSKKRDESEENNLKVSFEKSDEEPAEKSKRRRARQESESKADDSNEKSLENVSRGHRDVAAHESSQKDGKSSQGPDVSTGMTRTKVQNGGDSETHGLSKKELERRKWLAELDQQREEQRLRKQQEKERDRAGLQDQWADRFVYHKTVEQVSPRRGQPSRVTRDQGSVLGRAPDVAVESEAPPAAMRSSMVIGAGTLNETRYDTKKAQEKRQWLEELDRQREEQRLAKEAQKQRDRQDDGTWADRYPTDHKKLQGGNEVLQRQKVSPRTEPMELTQRTSSAPLSVLPVSHRDDEEPTTFLRGQGAFVDPTTRREQEEKRRVHLEYQAQVKAQIEEKERKKKEERERKIREDMEEERKLQMERDNMNRQQEMEQRKTREREELRQKQIAVLKTAMDEAQERALEEKNVRRIHDLKQRGHDVSQLKATYDEPESRMSGNLQPKASSRGPPAHTHSPRTRNYDISGIPGLGTDTTSDYPAHTAPPASPPPWIVDSTASRRDPEPQAQQPQRGHQSYSKDPYVEDRVLTPSRFRNPSQPRDDPDSPKREFGTQTLELKDLQAILQSLPDDIQIEYKMKVEEALKEKEKAKQAPSRKVHIKSAEENRRGVKKNPEKPPLKERTFKVGERPAWNQTQTRKIAKKNSEKDPFYKQKREESEARRVKRERQLLYLQELNKEKIPSSKSPGRSRDVSPEVYRERADRGRKPTRKANSGKLVKADDNRDSSPNILSLISNGDGKYESKSPQTTGRNSPPIPAVRHRTNARNDTDRDAFHYANNYLRNSQTDTKYRDASLSPRDDFIPFMRTTEILDPSKADDPVAISRENSRMERARRAYLETHNPANKGKKLDVYQDREREAALRASQNPIMNPSLVTGHPTARQDMILQQLSSLKQNLLQRQKELEDYMTPAELELEAGRA